MRGDEAESGNELLDDEMEGVLLGLLDDDESRPQRLTQRKPKNTTSAPMRQHPFREVSSLLIGEGTKQVLPVNGELREP